MTASPTIVGITAFQHDASCALIHGGRVVAFAEEERFDRRKHTAALPVRSLAWCLRHAGLEPEAVDRVAFYMDPAVVRRRFAAELASTLWSGGRRALARRTLWTCAFHWDLERLHQLGLPNAAVDWVRHHMCHARYAYALSGFDAAAVVTLDSIGEHTSSAIFDGQGPTLRCIETIDGFDSLGYLYGAVTEHLGFRRGDGEGTVMALASFAAPDQDAVNDLLAVHVDGTYRLDRRWLHQRFASPTGRRTTDAFTARFGPPRRADAPLEERHCRLAASLQAAVEGAVLAYCRRALELTGRNRLCLAGGVALNSVINHRVRSLGVSELFVPPAANDGGTSLGAALEVHQQLTGSAAAVPETVYLGPAFSDGEIEQALRAAGIDFRRVADPAAESARRLAAGEVIGWFQGAMESGPRSLGGRSILADPRNPATRDRINQRIKFREPFRPFAPSVLAEHQDAWFETGDLHLPYMLEVVPVRPERRVQIPAVLHCDGTARVQTVRRQDHPRFHALIAHFHAATGVPLVLNTSFNIKGEPIVATPADALRCTFSTGIDALVIGSCVVAKHGLDEVVAAGGG